MSHVLPAFLARPIAVRRLKSSFSKYLDATLRQSVGNLILEVKGIRHCRLVHRGSEGCAYYGTALEELLQLLIPDQAVGRSRSLREEPASSKLPVAR